MSEDKTIDKYLKAFERVKKNANSDPSWLRSLREGAMAAFAQKGFPTAKDEAWRYTDVAPIRKTFFNLGEGIAALSPETVAELKRKSGKNFLLIVNGKLLREHSHVPEGIEVMDLGEAILSSPELVEPYLGRTAALGDDIFCALNMAFFHSGLLIHVPAGRTVKEPIYAVFLTDPAQNASVFYPRNLFVIGQGSKAAIVETYVSRNGKGYFTNAVTEAFLEPGAILDHVKIQSENAEVFHIASTYTVQRRASSFSSFALSTGGRLARSECRMVLAEEGASCELSGLYLGDRDQVLDHQTFVDHRKPDGKSRQFFKGLMAGNSRGVFRGQVLVRQDAQRTDAQQTNKNLLLSDKAKVDTQPQLEILADDVKCSHGAAVGQLQEDAIFYLRSRGIGEKDAGRILAQGFAREVIERSNLDFMKEALSDLVNEKLKEQLYSGKE